MNTGIENEMSEGLHCNSTPGTQIKKAGIGLERMDIRANNSNSIKLKEKSRDISVEKKNLDLGSNGFVCQELNESTYD
ncbi:hypothetical protein ACU8KH_03606 [Lachancea thermotolerans]